jgi:accessory gene regulator B
MIEAVSERISDYVYRHNDRKHVSKEVMRYALISILTNVATVILSLLIGLTNGKFQETCLALLVIGVLRYLAGGHHLKSPVLCILASSAAVAVVPYITLNTPVLLAFTLVSALLVWRNAPVDFKNHTLLSDQRLKVMKLIALVLVLSNFLIQSDILAVSWMIVALTLLPYKGGEIR